MDTKFFYRDLTFPQCNQRIDDEPLIVNCAGCCHFDTPFETHNRNGRQDYYLQYVRKGTLRLWLEDGMHEMPVGSFLLTKPNTPYRYSLPAGESMEYLWIHFSGFHAARLLSRLHLECGHIYSGEECLAEITAVWENLFEEFTTRRRGFEDRCGAYLSEILITLSRHVAVNTPADEKKLKTIAWLHKHFASDTSVAELAAMEHLSESRYRLIFQRQTGYSPLEYRTALRLQHACDMLSTSDCSIKDISAECGYGDVLYFIRLFRKKIGMPPGQYRQAAPHSDKTADTSVTMHN